MNSKNDNAEKDLRLIYAQGNNLAYPESTGSMARFLSSQYNIKTVNNPRDKKGDNNGKKGDETNLKIRITATQALQVHTLEKLQRLKIQVLPEIDLVLVHTSLTSPNLMFDQDDLYKIYW